MALPVLRVGRVVLDRGIEPDAVALLLALVEGRLEGLAASPSAAAATTAPTTAAGLLALAVVIGIALALVGRALFLLGLGLAQLSFDLGLDLVAQVDVGGGLFALGAELVPLPEITQLGGGNAELVSDPSVGPPLADPGAGLVELGSQRLCLVGRPLNGYPTYF